MISQTNLKTKTPFTVSLFWKSKQLQREIIFRRFKTFMLSYFYRRLIRIFTHLELHQNEPIICVFIVLCKNQSELYLCQSSPELFSPSVMRRREELWGRDWRKTQRFEKMAAFNFFYLKNHDMPLQASWYAAIIIP